MVPSNRFSFQEFLPWMPFNLIFTSQSTFVEVISGVFKEGVKIFGISYLYISKFGINDQFGINGGFFLETNFWECIWEFI